MTPLGVLLPLALLVAVALAEFPSPNQISFFGKEDSSEDGIIQPNNPEIENEIDKTGQPETPPNDKTSEGGKKSEEIKKIEDSGETIISTSNDGNESSEPEQPPTAGYRLPGNIEPISYAINLRVNQQDLPNNDYKYEGSVSIDFVAKEATNVIKLHYDRRYITLTDIKLAETGEETGIDVTETEQKDLSVTICELVANTNLSTTENYTLTLTYDGIVNDRSRGFYKGSYFNENGEKRWYAVTHFEPIAARSAFPCFDEPALKAEFTITITHSTGYTAISNMPVDKEEEIDRNWNRVTFKTTPKMSTYLVAYAITDFATTNNSRVRVYSRSDVADMAEYAAITGENVLKALEEYTGIEYQISKMDQIALPLLQPGAMENWGLVTYRETALLYNENINATIDQQSVANIIAHEFAHQWFGNLVSPQWWSYVWLNEGFATYFQYYIADKINPEWRFMDQFNVACLQSRAFVRDADWTKTRPMDKEESNEQEISGMFDAIAYQKAGSVIRMFAHALGENAFREGLQNYLDTKKWAAATSSDLFKALDEIVDETVLPDNTTVEIIFGDWATKKGYPVITVTRNNRTNSVTVKQESFYLEKSEDDAEQSWYIPLNYVQENDEEQNFNDTAVMQWLKPDGESLTISENIKADGWIIFNKQQTGYYRVNYDKKNWNDIALYLNSPNFTTIHPLNRAQLIDDALNLASAEKLDYDVALSLLEYLIQETDYIVWKSAFNALSTLNKLLAPTEYYSEFSAYLLSVTDNLMENLTYTVKEDDPYLTKLLRVDAMKWACDSGSEICQTYATAETDKWLSDQTGNVTLPRDLRKVILCGALRNATFAKWQSVFAKYAGSLDIEEKAVILSALGCSLSSDTLEYFLDLTVQPGSIFTGRVSEVFQAVYSNSAVGVQVTLDFIINNLDKLLTYDARFSDNLETYINNLGSRVVLEEDVTKLQEIVARGIIPLNKTEAALDAANRNTKWLKKNGKEINAWFGVYNTVTEPPPPPTTTESAAGSISFTTFLLAAPLVLARLR